MPRAVMHHSGSVADLGALHDALGCAAMAAVDAWRGNQDSAALSLTEAHAAAEEAFGSGSAGAEALNVVLAAIRQAARSKTKSAGRDVPPPRPASDLSRLGQERTMANPAMTASPPAERSLQEIRELARRVNCGECWQVPGKPCTLDPEGNHVARFGRAMRRGLISGQDLIAVLQTLDAFTSATIVCDVPGGVS